MVVFTWRKERFGAEFSQFQAEFLARAAVLTEVTGMSSKIISLVLLLGVVGYFGYGYMGASANEAALESASQADNRVSLAVSGMT